MTELFMALAFAGLTWLVFSVGSARSNSDSYMEYITSTRPDDDDDACSRSNTFPHKDR